MTKLDLRYKMMKQMVDMDLECSTESTLEEILYSGCGGYENMSDQVLTNTYTIYVTTFCWDKTILNQFNLLILTEKI